jgi:hypothetical protein
MFTFVVVAYSGSEDGDIEPKIVYAFLTGIIASKLIDQYLIKEDKDI